jgi:ribonuclease HII
MKIYINSEGKISHFVGAIPDGFREMTEEEIQQYNQKKANKKNIEKQIKLLKEKKLEELLLADKNTPQEVKEYING